MVPQQRLYDLVNLFMSIYFWIIEEKIKKLPTTPVTCVRAEQSHLGRYCSFMIMAPAAIWAQEGIGPTHNVIKAKILQSPNLVFVG
jgi:hypothetical protein